MLAELREVVCKRRGCGRVFFVCRSCDRGQRYCGDKCRTWARMVSVVLARAAYALSDKCRERSRERQKRYRRRKALLAMVEKKSVTDQSSQTGQSAVCFDHGTVEQTRSVSAVSDVPQVAAAAQTDGEQAGTAQAAKAQGDRAVCDETHCHFCGCPGKVVRRHQGRGRFRWSQRGLFSGPPELHRIDAE